jgi:competence protein ComEC
MNRVHRSAVLMLAGIGFLCGIAIASFFVVGQVWWWAILFIGGCALLASRRYTTVVGVLLLATAVGLWRADGAFRTPAPLWELAETKPMVQLVGYVDGDFELTATGGRYTFRVLRVASDAGVQAVDDRALVSGPDWIKPRQGQVLVLEGKIQRARSFDDFDYVSYLAKDGVHATLYFPKYSVPTDLQLSRATYAKLWLGASLASVRIGVTESIARAVPQPMASYLAGILVGAKGVVSQELKDTFSRTGTSHILAISGYNITIVAAVLMSLLAPLGKRRAYWLAVAGIVMFVVLVGGSASVVRAAVMGVLVLTARQLGRAQDMGSAIVMSAVVMCWFHPLLLRWDVGFQLSFLAVLGIVYVQPLLQPSFERWFRYAPLASLMATTLSAQVLVLPILLFDFGQLAVYTLPANILVLPLVPLAMALGLATAVAGIIWPFAGMLVGQSAWLIAAYQLTVIRFFAYLPYAAPQVSISPAMLIALYVGIVAWLYLCYHKKKEVGGDVKIAAVRRGV